MSERDAIEILYAKGVAVLEEHLGPGRGPAFFGRYQPAIF